MSKTFIYVGEGGDVAASEVAEEIIEFAEAKPVHIRPANEDLDPELDEDAALFITVEHA